MYWQGGIRVNARILIVEDDPEIARVVRDMLIRENCEVTWATTGLEGWEDFQSSTYDLVLVDLMMPEMDGLTLCKNIRWKSNVPIMIISARKEDEDKVEGLQLGADDYLAKPFSLIELKARIESLLRRWKRYEGKKTDKKKNDYIHGLSIYLDEQKVVLDRTEIPLTMKEFAILELLSQNPNRIFTKSEVYQHVWKQTDAEGLHTVTVHIKSLREKLNDPVKTPRFIRTVWGKGYQFIGERI